METANNQSTDCRNLIQSNLDYYESCHLLSFFSAGFLAQDVVVVDLFLSGRGAYANFAMPQMVTTEMFASVPETRSAILLDLSGLMIVKSR